MDFGRINNIEQVNFALPPDHKSMAKVLGGEPALAPNVYVGGVLWASESFVGTLYPPKAKAADYAKYYMQQFNTIELNATHYKVPGKDTFLRWQSLAPQGFTFCPKVHQSISHADNLMSMLQFHNECNQLFSILGDKLGVVFMQLSPYFGTHRLEELMAFLDKSKQPGLFIELRHESWFTNEAALNKLCNFLYQRGLGLVLTDTPGRRDVLHMRLSNRTAVIRFNAHNNQPIDKVRMDEWIERIRHWLALGLENLCFFVHTPEQLYTPKLVIYFIQRLKKECGIVLRLPVLHSTEGEASTLF